MSGSGIDAAIVRAQLGRPPRDPWRVAVRCAYGYPSVIASPGRLEDGTPFPTLFWLTCPWIAETAWRAESAGETAAWASVASSDESIGEQLKAADVKLRQARVAESGGLDPCASVGIAGQRDPLGVKCLHAHAALALSGIDDPIGRAVLEERGRYCPDERCARLPIMESEQE